MTKVALCTVCLSLLSDYYAVIVLLLQIELTPALLPRVLSQSDQSKPLVLLCADELSDWLNALVSDLDQGTIYWLNRCGKSYECMFVK